VDVGLGFDNSEARFRKQICQGHRTPGIQVVIRVAGSGAIFDRLARHYENGGATWNKFPQKRLEFLQRILAVL
jgi:hypothetical protein